MANSTLQNHSSIKLDANAVLNWYDANARELPWRISPADRSNGIVPDPYRVWLSEIMLQQTTVAAVKEFYLRFTEKWPTVQDLASAPLEDVLKNWAGLGYYARARNLHTCARQISAKLWGNFPQSAEKLNKLSGVGPYTSAAIAAICFDEKIAVVDGNVERVVARCLALKTPARQARPLIRSTVQDAVPPRSGDFAQGMMDLGATICSPRNPDCNSCPLKPGCRGIKTGNPTDFPVRAKKVIRPTRYGHAFVFRRADGAVWLTKRPEKGLLALMTEVPGSAWENVKSDVQIPHEGDWAVSGKVVHVFTHFRLELDVWQLPQVKTTPPFAGWWAMPNRVAEEALPSVFRKVLKVVGLP